MIFSGINGARTKPQLRKGIDDTPQKFIADTIASGRTLSDEDLVEVLARQSAGAIQFIENLGIDLSVISQLGGHSAARTHREPNSELCSYCCRLLRQPPSRSPLRAAAPNAPNDTAPFPGQLLLLLLLLILFLLRLLLHPPLSPLPLTPTLSRPHPPTTRNTTTALLAPCSQSLTANHGPLGGT